MHGDHTRCMEFMHGFVAYVCHVRNCQALPNDLEPLAIRHTRHSVLPRQNVAVLAHRNRPAVPLSSRDRLCLAALRGLFTAHPINLPPRESQRHKLSHQNESHQYVCRCAC